MPSLYMPDVQVEIAFNSGYATPSASRTWTDVSTYVELAEGIDINFGRGDELSTTDANSVRLTLDNSDGRFTAARAASPYYPNVKIGRPIRVTATPVGGSASVRFVGYIDEWPVEWDGTDAYAKASITARSRLARLGLNTKLKSIVEQEILADDPAAYYTLGEPEGATFANDTSGNNAPRLVQTGSGTAVVFGTATGPSTDGLTAATFAGGKALRSPAVIAASPTAVWIECFFSTTGNTIYVLDTDADTAGIHGYGLNVISTGRLRALVQGATGGIVIIDSAASVNDGLTHHALLKTKNGGPTVLYLDGVQVGTDSTAITLQSVRGLTLGTQAMDIGTGTFTGTMAHVALGITTDIAAGRVTDHANAGLNGFTGETPAARLTRYAGYGGVPAAETSFDTGVDTIAHFDITGLGVIDAMRKVEATEGGVLFDGRDNTLTFHDRDRRYGAAAGLTLSMTTQQVEADYQPKLDRSTLVNIADAANLDGTVTAHVVDQASVDDYGEHSTSLEVASTNTEAPFQAASWRVNKYSEPAGRVPTLSPVDLTSFSAADQASILAAAIGTRIDLTGIPSQAAASTASYFVEGYTESIGPESYQITFNVSPGAIYLDVWTVEDPVLGQYDAYPIAF